MRVRDGGDPAPLSASEVSPLVDTERSDDSELGHTTETAGSVGILAGLVPADDLPVRSPARGPRGHGRAASSQGPPASFRG